VAHLLEAPVQVRLDGLPDGVPIGPDDHGAPARQPPLCV